MFVVAGPRTITLTGVDADGLSSAGHVNITVAGPPPNAAPTAVIVSPVPDQFTDPPDVFQSLKGTITSPGNANPISYKWVLKVGAMETVLASGTTISGKRVTALWKPGSYVVGHPGGTIVRIYLRATNSSNATASAYVEVTVFYPPA